MPIMASWNPASGLLAMLADLRQDLRHGRLLPRVAGEGAEARVENLYAMPVGVVEVDATGVSVTSLRQ